MRAEFFQLLCIHGSCRKRAARAKAGSSLSVFALLASLLKRSVIPQEIPEYLVAQDGTAVISLRNRAVIGLVGEPRGFEHRVQSRLDGKDAQLLQHLVVVMRVRRARGVFVRPRCKKHMPRGIGQPRSLQPTTPPRPPFSKACTCSSLCKTGVGQLVTSTTLLRQGPAVRCGAPVLLIMFVLCSARALRPEHS